MTSRLRRTVAALGVCATALVGAVATAPSASADPDIPFSFNIDATTHIAGLNQDTTITGGTFIGHVDLGEATIQGDLTLPDATSDVALFGLPLATATFRVEPLGPTTGTIDLATFTVTASSSFNIRIPSLKPKIFPINLVGSRCTTSEPIDLTMTGVVGLDGGTLSGEFTIPKFKDCGLATLALNLLVPGPGNTFTATATPATPAA